jgi:hypothetical protein
VLVYRYASPVVDDSDGVVHVDRHFDCGAASRQSLIHRVVHDLVDEVMKPLGTGRPDIHTRAFSYSFESLEDLDIFS